MISINIEYKLLGSIIADNNLMPMVARKVRMDYFSTIETRDMWGTMCDLYEHNKVISYTSIYNIMNVRHDNAPALIHHAIDEASTSAREVDYCIDCIIERACITRLKQLGDSILTGITSNSDSNVLIDKANDALIEISNAKYQDTVQSMYDYLPSYVDEYKDVVRGNVPKGISTGLSRLDDKLGNGLHTGLIIIGARSSVGKTSFALQIARNMASHNNKVLMFSLEMTKKEIADKYVASTIEDDDRRDTFRSRDMSEEEISSVVGRINTSITRNIMIDDNPQRTTSDISNIVKEHVRNGQCNVAIVDYLQLIDTSMLSAQNREREIALCTRQLKNLSKECDIPIILLCQLNRQVEARGDKKPCMADLRESGAIEQDANVILLLYKPSQAGIDTYHTLGGRDIDTNRLLVAILDKNRGGETGEVYLTHSNDMTTIIPRLL